MIWKVYLISFFAYALRRSVSSDFIMSFAILENFLVLVQLVVSECESWWWIGELLLLFLFIYFWIYVADLRNWWLFCVCFCYWMWDLELGIAREYQCFLVSVFAWLSVWSGVLISGSVIIRFDLFLHFVFVFLPISSKI